MRTATTLLVFCVGSLLAVGMVMLYSANLHAVQNNGSVYWTTQLAWCVLGLGACGVVNLFDYRQLKRLSVAMFVLAALLLVAVWIPKLGKEAKGAHRWIVVFGLSFQPSEFAKIALIVALAHYADLYQRHMSNWWRGLVRPGLIAGLLLALIFKEPDWGSTLLLASVTAVMLFVGGASWKHVVPPALLAIPLIVVAIMNNPLRLNRVLGWWGLIVDPANPANKDGVNYQAWEAMVAMGAGGTTGLGLGNGRQKFGFVPEHHTDFIYSILGEELGMIATVAVVAAFVGFLVCGLYIASRARERFGVLLATGITALIALQAFVNMAVVTSLLPNKGLALPFISRGGTSLLMMLTCVGLLLNVARHAGDPEWAEASDDDSEPMPELFPS
jgi:cell division protein FtsW